MKRKYWNRVKIGVEPSGNFSRGLDTTVCSCGDAALVVAAATRLLHRDVSEEETNSVNGVHVNPRKPHGPSRPSGNNHYKRWLYLGYWSKRTTYFSEFMGSATTTLESLGGKSISSRVLGMGSVHKQLVFWVIHTLQLLKMVSSILNIDTCYCRRYRKICKYNHHIRFYAKMSMNLENLAFLNSMISKIQLA